MLGMFNELKNFELFQSEKDRKEKELLMNLGLLAERDEQNKFLGYGNDPRFMDSFFENITSAPNPNIINVEKVYEYKDASGGTKYSLEKPTFATSKLVDVTMDNQSQIEPIIENENRMNEFRGNPTRLQTNTADTSPRGLYLDVAAEPFSAEQQTRLLEAEKAMQQSQTGFDTSTARATLTDIGVLTDKTTDADVPAKGVSPQLLFTLMSLLNATTSNRPTTKITPGVARPGVSFAQTDPYERFRRGFG